MDFKYIKDYYKVPAEFGREIEYNGKRGYIVEDLGNYIGVNFHCDKRTKVLPLHPTDGVIYLELGKPRKLTAGQKRYREYKELDLDISFSQFLGIKSKGINY